MASPAPIDEVVHSKDDLKPIIDVLLTADEIDRIASSDEPYIKILQVQDDGSQELMYIDTWKQELLFDPETYNGNASSNSSVVIKLVLVSPGTYTISNAVIPKVFLWLGSQMPTKTPYQVNNVKFEQNVTKFKKEPKTGKKGETKFAIYTEDGSTKLYLMPRPLPVYDEKGSVIGKRKTILAEGEHQGQDKYVFSFAKTNYKPCPGTEEDDGAGEKQQANPEGTETQEGGVQGCNCTNCIVL